MFNECCKTEENKENIYKKRKNTGDLTNCTVGLEVLYGEVVHLIF